MLRITPVQLLDEDAFAVIAADEVVGERDDVEERRLVVLLQDTGVGVEDVVDQAADLPQHLGVLGQGELEDLLHDAEATTQEVDELGGLEVILVQPLQFLEFGTNQVDAVGDLDEVAEGLGHAAAAAQQAVLDERALIVQLPDAEVVLPQLRHLVPLAADVVDAVLTDEVLGVVPQQAGALGFHVRQDGVQVQPLGDGGFDGGGQDHPKLLVEVVLFQPETLDVRHAKIDQGAVGGFRQCFYLLGVGGFEVEDELYGFGGLLLVVAQ